MSQVNQANIDLAFNLARLSTLTSEQFRYFLLMSNHDDKEEVYKTSLLHYEILEVEIQNCLTKLKNIQEKLK